MALTGVELIDKIHVALSCGTSSCRCAKPSMTHCPAHDDRTPSLSLRRGDVQPVIVNCKGGCSQDAVMEALRDRGLWPAKSSARMQPKQQATGSEQQRAIVRTYDYRDGRGDLVSQVVRYEPKDFRQRRPDGMGGWIWNMDGVKPILYHLPELIASPYSEPVIMVEGERDVETAESLGFVATTTPMGAGKASKCDLHMLWGRAVLIIADDDEPGRKHAGELEHTLGGHAASVTRVSLPAHDLTDYVGSGATREDLEQLITGPTNGARARETRVSQPLDEVHAFLGRFVSYPSKEAHVAHTLWVAHAHLMDAWESTPRIAFLSPEPASGKSRALEVTELLVPMPVEAVNVTAAYLFRKVGGEEGRPTILYDEIDTVFGPRAKENEEIRGLLNAGHRRGAVAGRCVVRGKTVLTEEIPAYCAVALAGLGGLPDTILSRCVIVRMRRRAPDEPIEPFRRREVAAAGHAMRDRLEAWARSVDHKVRAAWPAMPPSITDRDADVWEALLAVADAAGGDWPERARVTAVTLVTFSKGSTPSLGVRLLSDLRDVFGKAEALATKDILEELNGMDEAPWGDIRGKPLNARGLAQRLRPYGIGRTTVRIGDTTAKGYARQDCYDAWKRYLPALDEPVGSPPYESVTSVTNGARPPSDGNDPDVDDLPDYVSGLPI